MAVSNPEYFTSTYGLRDHRRIWSVATKRKPRCSSTTRATLSILPRPLMHKPWVAPKPAIQHIKLDRRENNRRNDSIHKNKTTGSHESAARREVSVAAYQLAAKGCQALVAIYDTIMTLAELAMGACKLFLGSRVPRSCQWEVVVRYCVRTSGRRLEHRNG